MIGQTISHYKILEKLGEGGMGVVYKAHDTKLDRDVALKFLPADLTADPEARERFIHEAKAASALSHPNICGIHTIEEYEHQHFIDMELLEGKTICVLLKEKEISEKEISLKEVMDIAVQIGEGLNAAHKKGIVHRDIKPDNIMITDESLVKIMDFGLAKLKGSSKLTKTHSTIGTFSYMSPEQARGEEIDQRSDIFSFGAVLYEMVTGRRPFKGEHEAAVIYSLVNETPEPLARYKSDVPDELQRVVDKALTKEREKRYQHVDEMIVDLRSAALNLSSNIVTVKQRSKVSWIFAVCVVVLAVLGIYLFYPQLGPTSANSKTIAVLPFNNMSENKEDEYFSDGITEDILTQLSKIADLSVISRTTIMQYKGTKKSLREIGKELNVGTILEGSVRHFGNRIRIVAQLVDAHTDKHLWAETYDRELKDVFAIQSDVAEKIAHAFRAQLSASEKERIGKKPTENLEAYMLYLKGRYYWNKRSEEGFKMAIENFKQAIEKDPLYAPAYAGIADCYNLLCAYSLSPSKESVDRARAAAQRSLEIDPSLAEGHEAIAHAGMLYDWNWNNVEREFKQALKLNPDYATAHQRYAIYLSALGRMDEATKEIRRAHELDPLSLIINTDIALFSFLNGEYNQAIEQCKKTLELDSNFAVAVLVLGMTYEQQEKLTEAMTLLRKAQTLTGNNSIYLSALGHSYGVAGLKDSARIVLNNLREISKHRYVSPYAVATVYIGIGEFDHAMEWLQKASEEHAVWLIHMHVAVDPRLKSLHLNQKFLTLIERMGIKR